MTNVRTADDRDHHWQVWIDTGGTFTDCLAVAPDGSLHRAKVLSSGVLRATVVARPSTRTVQLDQSWGGRDGFLNGAHALIAGCPGPPIEIVASTTDPPTIDLRSDPGAAADCGARCEIMTGLEAPVVAAHVITGTPLGRSLPPLELRLGTTRATNALLERRGAPTVLVTTEGFGDVLRIGTQQRHDLFALEIVRPAPLHTEVIEVAERTAADGTILRILDGDRVRSAAGRLVEGGVRSAAVAFVNAWREPRHEQAAAAVLRDAGFDHVTTSEELAPLIGFLERVETTVVEAYLAPLLATYLAGVRSAVDSDPIQIMTSAGGLVGVAGLRACDALLSGPAGGVVGAALAARRSGVERVLALDMGGTSTDVSRWSGEYEYVFEHRVGDARLVAPALAIETVAAGGGSICRCEAGRIAVGPVSAGADPGPACYGAGGPLTLTDVNLLLGRLVPERFGIPIDRQASERALTELRHDLERAGASTPSADEDLLDGLLRIADERMAAAIHRISVRHGYDPTDHVLVAFGGAGPQHACAVAELLGMRSVLVPRDASLLSAAGLGHAVVERFEQRQVLQSLHDVAPDLESVVTRLGAAAIERVVDGGVDRKRVRIRRRLVHLRLAGQDSTLEVNWHPGADLAVEFEVAYRTLYGYDPPRRPIEVESVRVIASSVSDAVVPAPRPPTRPAQPRSRHPVYASGGWRDVPSLDRADLEAGMWIEGPALVVEDHSATVVSPGWRLAVDGADALRIARGEPS